MRTHVTVLGWLHIAHSVLMFAAGALITFVYLSLGRVADGANRSAFGGLPHSMVGIGSTILALIALFCLPGIIAGIGLLLGAPWGRILTIVISILDLFSAPFGTALGIYSLIILFNPETTALFDRRNPVY